VPEATIGQRITRAKRKITEAGIPYRIPTDAERRAPAFTTNPAQHALLVERLSWS
jgi:predicted RNA polymerase sigma factor